MAGSSEQFISEGHRHRLEGQYEEAETAYRSALEADAGCAEALWGLGLTLMNMGEFDDSIQCLEQACSLQPESQKYLLDLGKHQTMLGMFDEAKPVFEKVVALNADSREAEEARNQLRYY